MATSEWSSVLGLQLLSYWKDLLPRPGSPDTSRSLGGRQAAVPHSFTSTTPHACHVGDRDKGFLGSGGMWAGA